MHIISVDVQNEFSAPGGGLYAPRPCIPFLTDTFVPFVRQHGYTIAEIISDYRTTAPNAGESMCVPGQWSYESLIASDIKHPWVWVKAEPSPAWTRAGAGDAHQLPGEPYSAPDTFTAWLAATIGPPDQHNEIVLVGLMLEICVLSTLQELKYRGYEVKVLVEGVDTYSGNAEQKRLFLETLFPFWGQSISWHELQAAHA